MPFEPAGFAVPPYEITALSRPVPRPPSHAGASAEIGAGANMEPAV
jgi:hypothetical protein